MPEGEVVFWNDTGGYGFIETPATDEDVFVHAEDIGVDVAEGDRLRFDVVDAKHGPRAEAPRLLQGASGGSEPGGDTEVYDDPGGDTQVYGDASGEDDGLAYCFACGADLGPYPDPAFCPECGTDLDP